MAFEDALRGLGFPANATSQDKLLQAAYTGPVSGDRISFRYREPISKNTKMRLGENRYVGIDGVEYQSTAIDETRILWDVFFDDKNHAESGQKFEALCLEPAPIGTPGLLEHPRGEVLEVVVATVGRIDDPNHNADQTIIRVEFRRQLTLPADLRDRPELTVQRALIALSESASGGFSALSFLEKAADRVASAREFVSQINVITETMGNVIDATGSILADFNAIKTDILVNLNTLLEAPAVLAAQVSRLIQFALDAPGDLFDKIGGYDELHKRTLGIDDDTIPILFGAAADSVTLARANVQGLVATVASGCLLTSVVRAAPAFSTRQAAYEAASTALVSAGNVTAALEVTEQSYVGEPLTRRYYSMEATLQRLNVVKRLAYASTQQLTARLKTTRIIRLPRDTSILDVCWSEYQDISDESLQAFIDANDLSVEEIAIIPAGTYLYV